MNRRLVPIVALAISIVALSGPARAGGYLWLGSEMQGEGSIYRYNINTGVVDLSLSPALPVGASHWNNMATDGARLYLGTPTTQYVGLADPYTGASLGSAVYSPSLAGHKEDGAFRASSGTLWRVTYTGQLYEITAAASGSISLSLFDVRGRLLETLMRDEYKTLGIHELDYRPHLNSGVYVLRLQWGAGVASRKFVILK